MLAIACPARRVTSKAIADRVSRSKVDALNIRARTRGLGGAEQAHRRRLGRHRDRGLRMSAPAGAWRRGRADHPPCTRVRAPRVLHTKCERSRVAARPDAGLLHESG